MDRKCGCAVLAGGAGKRMGNVNKAELEYRGQTFAESIMSEMAQTGMPCYLSVANFEQEVPAGWNAVRDLITGQDGGYIGPMGGIYSCLVSAGKDGLEGLFFAPCDAPLYSRDAVSMLSEYIGADTDAVVWKTPDGRQQTTFGWYSVRCIPVMEAAAACAEYKLTDLLDKVRCRIIDTAETDIDDRIFSNINKQEDYLRLRSSAGRRHILICGVRQAGKTTLIENVIHEIKVPVYGYSTRIFRKDADGISRVYMYPAGKYDGSRNSYNYIGSTSGKIRDVNTEAFDQLGTGLIKSAKADGIIVMDEIGFMERDAADFRRAVTEAFDGGIHILAAIKDTDKYSEHIEAIRKHPAAELIMLTEKNRNMITEVVKPIIKGWEQEIIGRRERNHE